MWLCPSCAVAVAMYDSAPEIRDQDTVLAPHSVDAETLLGEQGPEEMEGTSGEKELKITMFKRSVVDCSDMMYIF